MQDKGSRKNWGGRTDSRHQHNETRGGFTWLMPFHSHMTWIHHVCMWLYGISGLGGYPINLILWIIRFDLIWFALNLLEDQDFPISWGELDKRFYDSLILYVTYTFKYFNCIFVLNLIIYHGYCIDSLFLAFIEIELCILQ